MNIGIYIYDDAEVLDFSGPFEVFSTAKRLASNHWNVFLVAEHNEPVVARGGYQVLPHYSMSNHPEIDLLVVVGGVHTAELEKPAVIDWIARVDKQATHVISVCTGAFLLAKAGVIDGKAVTTHWEDIGDLRDGFPQLEVVEGRRWVDTGKYVTSGGISAGIDMSLHMVSRLTNYLFAQSVARQMDYQWQQR
ncbi:DJ-1/PfpI family protein [Vibrio ulleungensis]|uniref:DJ-1/PfpI family protein n=1 Tax=Vibrio ulleungensis TaxID=2807619 RepID=A0ABS2HBR9_9VIBR|nr:DJ-1/PfpI family protein [Vibrio ulleungensis]MBM7035050.1 DJ-1/PfpI family protein [Vibrio ulleungensis]